MIPKLQPKFTLAQVNSGFHLCQMADDGYLRLSHRNTIGEDAANRLKEDLEELLFWWPSITRKATEEWAKGFCQSVAKQSKRHNWAPSEKQLALMRRMHSDHFTAHACGDDDLTLIE